MSAPFSCHFSGFAHLHWLTYWVCSAVFPAGMPVPNVLFGLKGLKLNAAAVAAGLHGGIPET